MSLCILPANLMKKSVEELKELKEPGLTMVYVGCESGDDKVVDLVNTGETFVSSRDALNSARIMNETQSESEFVSTLVVSFPLGEQRFRAGVIRGNTAIN